MGGPPMSSLPQSTTRASRPCHNAALLLLGSSTSRRLRVRRPRRLPVLLFFSLSIARVPDQRPPQPVFQRHLRLIAQMRPGLLDDRTPPVGIVDEVVLVLARLRDHLPAVSEQLLPQRRDLAGQVLHADLRDLG